MDDRLEKAIQHINYKATLIRQRENARLRFATDLIHAANGGLFTAGPQLITFVDCLIRQGQSDAVLIDDKGNPIHIADLAGFLDAITSVHHEASNAYFSEHEQIRKARSVKAAVGLTHGTGPL